MAVTVEDVRRIAAPLPRADEVVVRDRIKFRVGRIVWLAFSRDETQLGLAYPPEERAARSRRSPRCSSWPGQPPTDPGHRSAA